MKGITLFSIRVLLLITLIFLPNGVHADNIEAVLSSTDGSDAFQVQDSAGTTLIDVQSDGKIGIGTATPQSTLDVNGGLTVTTAISGGVGTTSTPRIAFGNNADASGGYGAMAVGYNASATGIVGIALGQSVTASGYGATAMGNSTIASGDYATAMGNSTTASGYSATAMGNGTTASSNYSTATGSYTTASGLYSTAMGSNITAQGDYSFGIGLDNTSNTITAANTMAIMGGNVGIGTTSPSNKLHVAGGEASYLGYFYNDNNGSGSAYGIYSRGDAYGTGTGNGYGGSFYAYGGNTSGVAYGTRSYAYAYGTSVAYGIYSYAIGGSTTGREYAFYGYGDGRFNGDLEYTGIISDVSDERLKENIEPINGALEKIEAINGVYFNMIDTPEQKEVGVIAQDVQKVLPEAVHVMDEENGYLGVSYPSLIPVLIEAVKELKAENEALKTGYETLNALVCQDHPDAAVCQ